MILKNPLDQATPNVSSIQHANSTTTTNIHRINTEGSTLTQPSLYVMVIQSSAKIN